MKAVAGLFRLIFINVLVMCLIAYFALSLMTKKFPPDLKVAKAYASNFIDVKKNYKDTLTKTQAAITEQNIHDDFDVAAAAQNNALAQLDNEDDHAATAPAHVEKPTQESIETLAILTKKMYVMQAQIDRIEEQNKLLMKEIRERK